MAKRNKSVELDGSELKPQVIGYSYQKKSNFGRVLLIFVAFLIVVYYINDISIFFNNLFGRKSSVSIQNLADDDNKENNKNSNIEKKEIAYNIYENGMTIEYLNTIINNFTLNGNMLTFDINNTTNNNMNLSNEKIYLETYSESKTLLERFKIDVGNISSNSKVGFQININSPFYYIVFSSKNNNDYPLVTLDDNKKIICTKDNETLVYSFNSNSKLTSIKHTINDSNITDSNYYTRYNIIQNRVNIYNNIDGISASFNASANGYTAIITLDLESANLSEVNEVNYYAYNEEAKVVKFEMQARGYTCN